MDFSKLTKDELILYNQRFPEDIRIMRYMLSHQSKERLASLAAERFIKYININDFEQAFVTNAVVALDRSVRYPQNNSSNRYYANQILYDADENIIDIFARVYNLKKDMEIRNIIVRILELQGLIVEMTAIAPLSNIITRDYASTIDHSAPTIDRYKQIEPM